MVHFSQANIGWIRGVITKKGGYSKGWDLGLGTLHKARGLGARHPFCGHISPGFSLKSCGIPFAGTSARVFLSNRVASLLRAHQPGFFSQIVWHPFCGHISPGFSLKSCGIPFAGASARVFLSNRVASLLRAHQPGFFSQIVWHPFCGHISPGFSLKSCGIPFAGTSARVFLSNRVASQPRSFQDDLNQRSFNLMRALYQFKPTEMSRLNVR